MTTPTPDAFDPTADLRALYGQAEIALIRALTVAVADTLASPESQPLVERRLRRELRTITAGLNAAAPGMIAQVIDDARQTGLDRAATDQ